MKIRTFINIGIAILMLFVVVAGACYFSSKQKMARLIDREPVFDEVNLAASDVVWSYETRDMSDEREYPETIVTVQVGDTKREVGRYVGSCWDRPVEDRETNEISGIRCWYAGGGDDVGVFREGRSYTVKHRVLEEGTAEEGGFIGEFEVIYSL